MAKALKESRGWSQLKSFKIKANWKDALQKLIDDAKSKWIDCKIIL
jgi:hypothetical protein